MPAKIILILVFKLKKNLNLKPQIH